MASSSRNNYIIFKRITIDELTNKAFNPYIPRLKVYLWHICVISRKAKNRQK